jgi:hypothetical protein
MSNPADGKRVSTANFSCRSARFEINNLRFLVSPIFHVVETSQLDSVTYTGTNILGAPDVWCFKYRTDFVVLTCPVFLSR